MTTDAKPVARKHPELPAAALLSDRVLYRISGPGTDDFLQGQMSQNLADVAAGYSPRAAASTPKGRAYLLTRLVRDGEDILLSMPASIADEVARHLNKYLMLFRGTSMERLDDGQVFGLFGEEAATALSGDKSALPGSASASTAVEGGYLVRTNSTPEGVGRFELWLPSGRSEAQQARLDNLGEATLADWDASEIAAGIAELEPETRETWVPQMLNWQHLQGIHFKKGCYTGQEIIARMHFLGQLKKSLFRLGASGGDTPAAGSAMVADGKPVGEVVRSVALDDGSVELLGVLKHAAAGSELQLQESGQPLTILPLPYTVPEREEVEENPTDT
ncbi:CAF17-like 4Fe-4S cluster assembly/insertion protein YgfZ [Marinobacter zhanjiangensis]|uniref:tRNA-modifying protein YgfZ n=1 Tax=Marinobacter zhanjiangensis TaxID=578215 RepID=A0ABQ3B6A1_9GAMM|nr:folate-binding protein YgfZ [Marinobacter zhanjiangensis]GGY75847.1 tRNA-modifying protein YgfZ [Marinobacter zhanjiangensis]